MLRFLLILLACAAAAAWIEPRWSAEDRALTLRLRSNDELVRIMRAQSRSAGQWAIQALTDRLDTPPVGAPAREPDESAERITRGEQEQLDRLIEEKTREQ